MTEKLDPKLQVFGVDFKERDMIVSAARWEPKARDVDTVVPMQKFIIANAGIQVVIHQFVARHKDFQGGRPVNFGDQVTIGRQTFIQFLIKPIMCPLMINTMDGDIERLRKGFEILVKTGAVVAFVQDPAKVPAAPKLGVNFKD